MCRTGGRRCPSSRRTGSDLADYNKHRREMYAIKKENQKAAEQFKKWNKDGDGLAVVPQDATREQVAAILGNANSNVEPIIGKKSKIEQDQLSEAQRYQQAADELVAHFMKDDGKFDFPTNYRILEDHKTAKEDFGDFTYVGSGIEKAAYYHKPTGIVYKLRFSTGNQDEEETKRYEKQQQYLIANVDDDVLAKDNVRYAKAYFMSSQGISVVGQEYLGPDEYEEVNMLSDDLTDAAFGTIVDNGFSDFHAGNMKIHKETKQIVLLDCLAVNDEIRRQICDEEMSTAKRQ